MSHFPIENEPERDPKGVYLTLRLDFDGKRNWRESVRDRSTARFWADCVLYSGPVAFRRVAEDLIKWLDETKGGES